MASREQTGFASRNRLQYRVRRPGKKNTLYKNSEHKYGGGSGALWAALLRGALTYRIVLSPCFFRF